MLEDALSTYDFSMIQGFYAKISDLQKFELSPPMQFVCMMNYSCDKMAMNIVCKKKNVEMSHNFRRNPMNYLFEMSILCKQCT